MNRNTTAKESTEGTIGDFGDLSTWGWGRQGWICPRCGNVLSPATTYCIFCVNGNSNTIAQPFTNLTTCEANIEPGKAEQLQNY